MHLDVVDPVTTRAVEYDQLRLDEMKEPDMELRLPPMKRRRFMMGFHDKNNSKRNKKINSHNNNRRAALRSSRRSVDKKDREFDEMKKSI